MGNRTFNHSSQSIFEVAGAILATMGVKLNQRVSMYELEGALGDWEKKVILSKYIGRTDIPAEGTSIHEVEYTKGHYNLVVFQLDGERREFNEYKLTLKKKEEVLFSLVYDYHNSTIEGSHSFVSQAVYTERQAYNKAMKEEKIQEDRRAEENKKTSRKIHQLQEIIKNGGLGSAKAHHDLQKLAW